LYIWATIYCNNNGN